MLLRRRDRLHPGFAVEDLRFAAAFGKNGRIVGAVTFNHGKWLQYYASLIEKSAPFPPPPPGYDVPANAHVMPARFPDPREPTGNPDVVLTGHDPTDRGAAVPARALKETHVMDAATAWAEAMKFENRPNPYRFFDELRKTPVAQVSDKIYVVTGYREAVALAHDPRVSSDISRSPSGLFGEKQARPRARSEAAQARDRACSSPTRPRTTGCAGRSCGTSPRRTPPTSSPAWRAWSPTWPTSCWTRS